MWWTSSTGATWEMQLGYVQPKTVLGRVVKVEKRTKQTFWKSRKKGERGKPGGRRHFVNSRTGCIKRTRKGGKNNSLAGKNGGKKNWGQAGHNPIRISIGTATNGLVNGR